MQNDIAPFNSTLLKSIYEDELYKRDLYLHQSSISVINRRLFNQGSYHGNQAFFLFISSIIIIPIFIFREKLIKVMPVKR